MLPGLGLGADGIDSQAARFLDTSGRRAEQKRRQRKEWREVWATPEAFGRCMNMRSALGCPDYMGGCGRMAGGCWLGRGARLASMVDMP